MKISRVYKGYYSEHDWIQSWMVEFTMYAAKTNEPLECKAMLDAFLRLYPSRRQAIIDLLKLQPETEEVIKFLEKA